MLFCSASAKFEFWTVHHIKNFMKMNCHVLVINMHGIMVMTVNTPIFYARKLWICITFARTSKKLWVSWRRVNVFSKECVLPPTKQTPQFQFSKAIHLDIWLLKMSLTVLRSKNQWNEVHIHKKHKNSYFFRKLFACWIYLPSLRYQSTLEKVCTWPRR